jgi:hypothetical protein
MRIALVLRHGQPGGNQSLTELAPMLRREGHEAQVAFVRVRSR